MGALSLTDITTSVRNAKVCFHDNALKAAIPSMHNGRLHSNSGNYGAVFKLNCGVKQKAVRIWTKDLALMPELPIRSKILSEKIAKLNKSFFIDFDFQEKGLLVLGQWTPIVVMDWCNGDNLKDAIAKNLNKAEGIKSIAKNFLDLIKYLHKNFISHGDLQHGNILVNEDYSMKLIDYDSLYIPCAELDNKVEAIKGLPDYQHPNRMGNVYANSKVDYFSEVVIYLSLAALLEAPELWNKYNIANKDYSLLFSQSDFLNFENSAIYKELNKLSKDVQLLASILVTYLKTSDITKLQPFYKQAEKIGCILYKNELNSLFCINCGNQFIDLDDLFCMNCGVKRYYENQ